MARIMPFGIRIVKEWTTQRKKEIKADDGGSGKSRVRSRGLVFFLKGMNEKNDFLHVHARNWLKSVQCSSRIREIVDLVDLVILSL